jgi:hypothetical protein
MTQYDLEKRYQIAKSNFNDAYNEGMEAYNALREDGFIPSEFSAIMNTLEVVYEEIEDKPMPRAVKILEWATKRADKYAPNEYTMDVYKENVVDLFEQRSDYEYRV